MLWHATACSAVPCVLCALCCSAHPPVLLHGHKFILSHRVHRALQPPVGACCGRHGRDLGRNALTYKEIKHRSNQHSHHACGEIPLKASSTSGFSQNGVVFWGLCSSLEAVTCRPRGKTKSEQGSGLWLYCHLFKGAAPRFHMASFLIWDKEVCGLWLLVYSRARRLCIWTGTVAGRERSHSHQFQTPVPPEHAQHAKIPIIPISIALPHCYLTVLMMENHAC